MKVFVLGGYGVVGIPATKLLAEDDSITQLTVAGRDLERAEKAARETGAKANAVHADGADQEQLSSLLEGYDLVVNAASDDVATSIMKAAIRTRTHYCDAGVTVEEMLSFSPEAEAAGITAIVTAGLAPCITNLMGVNVAGQLDKVEQVQMGFGDIYNFQTGKELTVHQWLEDPRENLPSLKGCRPHIGWMLSRAQGEGSRTVSTFHDGEFVMADAMRTGVDAPTFQGGTVTSYPYYVGDPTFPSLPLDLSDRPPVEILFSPLPPHLHDLLRGLAMSVLDGEADAEAATRSFFDTVESDPDRWLTLPDDFVPSPKIWVRAVGWVEGRAARSTCWLTEPMWDVGGYFLTSVALAVAVRRVLHGGIRMRGVMTAERAFDPLPFLEEVESCLPGPLPDGGMFGESLEWLD